MKISDFVSIDIHKTNNNNIIFNLGDEHTNITKENHCKDCKLSNNCYDSNKFIELMKNYCIKNNISFDLFMELPYASNLKDKNKAKNIDFYYKTSYIYYKKSEDKKSNSYKNFMKEYREYKSKKYEYLSPFTRYLIVSKYKKGLFSKILRKYHKDFYCKPIKDKNNKKNIRFHYNDIRNEYIFTKLSHPDSDGSYNSLNKYYYKLFPNYKSYFKFMNIILNTKDLKKDLLKFNKNIFEYIDITIPNKYQTKISKQLDKIPKQYKKLILENFENYYNNLTKSVDYNIEFLHYDHGMFNIFFNTLIMDIYQMSIFIYYDLKTENGIFLFINGCAHSSNYRYFMNKYLKFKELYSKNTNKCNDENKLYSKYKWKGFKEKCIDIPDRIFKQNNLYINKHILSLTCKKKINKDKVKSIWNSLFGKK